MLSDNTNARIEYVPVRAIFVVKNVFCFEIIVVFFVLACVYYCTNGRGSCEVDFVIDTGEHIIPVEVKTEVNLKAKSLRMYKDKYDPEISVRTSMSDYKKEDWIVNLPLYAVEEIKASN